VINLFDPDDADKVGHEHMKTFTIVCVLHFNVQKLSHIEFPTHKDKREAKELAADEHKHHKSDVDAEHEPFVLSSTSS